MTKFSPKASKTRFSCRSGATKADRVKLRPAPSMLLSRKVRRDSFWTSCGASAMQARDSGPASAGSLWDVGPWFGVCRAAPIEQSPEITSVESSATPAKKAWRLRFGTIPSRLLFKTRRY